MTEKALLNQTPWDQTYWHTNPDNTDEVVIEKVFDRDPVLEHCARMRNEVQQTGELRLAMEIPVSVFYDLMRKGRISKDRFLENGGIAVSPEELRALFNDPDLALLRCMDKL